jgi:hypothetical protein
MPAGGAGIETLESCVSEPSAAMLKVTIVSLVATPANRNCPLADVVRAPVRGVQKFPPSYHHAIGCERAAACAASAGGEWRARQLRQGTVGSYRESGYRGGRKDIIIGVNERLCFETTCECQQRGDLHCCGAERRFHLFSSHASRSAWVCS